MKKERGGISKRMRGVRQDKKKERKQWRRRARRISSGNFSGWTKGGTAERRLERWLPTESAPEFVFREKGRQRHRHISLRCLVRLSVALDAIINSKWCIARGVLNSLVALRGDQPPCVGSPCVCERIPRSVINRVQCVSSFRVLLISVSWARNARK